MTTEMMEKRLAALDAEGKGIFAKAAEEERDPTQDERARLDAIGPEFETLYADKRRLEQQEDRSRHANASAGRQVDPDNPGKGAEDKGDPWARPGEFYQAVAAAASPDQPALDNRLRIGAAAATTYSNTKSGVDGGFAIPQNAATEIKDYAFGDESFLSLTDNTTVQGNGMSFPTDETTPWGTVGILAYWAAEAATVTQNKVKLGERVMKLNKLMALAPVTDELLADAAALEDHIQKKMGQAITYKINEALVNGNGAGQPLGFANSLAIVSQAKVGSQTADTINATNVGQMFGRMLPESLSRAVWLIAPDSYHQLFLMTVGDQPIWTPPSEGFKRAPGGTLMGRPVIITMQATTLGDLGDIYFADFGSYKTITKAGGIQMAMSMHLLFDYDEMVFRATFRLDGQPWASAAVTPPNSAITLSSFVSLAARA